MDAGAVRGHGLGKCCGLEGAGWTKRWSTLSKKNVSRHGDSAMAAFVIPLKRHPAKFCGLPVNRDGVVLVQSGFEVVNVGFRDVLCHEVIDDESKGYGVVAVLE